MNRTTLYSILTFILLNLLIACGNKKKPHYNNQTSANDSCNCNPNWFPHTNTPPPLEGQGSPFDDTSTTNCIFHQWSMQKFLWLTRPMANGHVFFQDSMMLVTAQLVPVPVQTVPLVLDDTLQAGSEGVLYTNPGFAADGLKHRVYYSIFVNETLMNAAEGFKTAMLADTNLLNNSNQFPIGSLEMKVSWVEIEAIPETDRASYYTTDASIKVNGTYQTKQVALLGLHVVGIVINHPEFIWATFQHNGMGPLYDWQSTTTTQDAPIVSSTQQLLFASGNTTGLGGITWNGITHTPDTLSKAYELYQYGTPRTAQNAFLSNTSQVGATNYDNIAGLNACVNASLAANDVFKNYFYNGSIWINTDGFSQTQQDSIILAQGNNLGKGTTNAVARGSLNVTNLTMETYVQTEAPNTANVIHTINSTQLFNCLSCHSAPTTTLTMGGKTYRKKSSPLYISHSFRYYLGVNGDKGTTLSESKKQGVLDFVSDNKERNTK
jgi:hypothetical protein